MGGCLCLFKRFTESQTTILTTSRSVASLNRSLLSWTSEVLHKVSKCKFSFPYTLDEIVWNVELHVYELHIKYGYRWVLHIFTISEYAWWKHQTSSEEEKNRKTKRGSMVLSLHPEGAFHGSEQLHTAICFHKTISVAPCPSPTSFGTWLNLACRQPHDCFACIMYFV